MGIANEVFPITGPWKLSQNQPEVINADLLGLSQAVQI